MKGTLQKPNRETVALGAVLQDQEVTFIHYTLLVAAAPLSLSLCQLAAITRGGLTTL